MHTYIHAKSHTHICLIWSCIGIHSCAMIFVPYAQMRKHTRETLEDSAHADIKHLGRNVLVEVLVTRLAHRLPRFGRKPWKKAETAASSTRDSRICRGSPWLRPKRRRQRLNRCVLWVEDFIYIHSYKRSIRNDGDRVGQCRNKAAAHKFCAYSRLHGVCMLTP